MLSIGIDVSKGKSTVCGMKPGGEIVYAPFEVQHTREGMSELVSLLRSSGEEVRAVLESTGSYHCPVVAALYGVKIDLRLDQHGGHLVILPRQKLKLPICILRLKLLPIGQTVQSNLHSVDSIGLHLADTL